MFYFIDRNVHSAKDELDLCQCNSFISMQSCWCFNLSCFWYWDSWHKPEKKNAAEHLSPQIWKYIKVMLCTSRPWSAESLIGVLLHTAIIANPCLAKPTVNKNAAGVIWGFAGIELFKILPWRFCTPSAWCIIQETCLGWDALNEALCIEWSQCCGSKRYVA